jgi:hypothetical protein
MDILDSGFCIESPVLSEDECKALLGTFAKSTTIGRAGTRHMMSNSEVGKLAGDRRLMRIAQAALGGTAVQFRATLFAKSGAVNWLIPWHHDTALRF